MVCIKLMVMRDLFLFLILVVILAASSAVVMHAIIYPDYPLGTELWLRTFNWGFFSLFLTDTTGCIMSDFTIWVKVRVNVTCIYPYANKFSY